MEPHLLGGGPTGGVTGPELFPKAVEAFQDPAMRCESQADRDGTQYRSWSGTRHRRPCNCPPCSRPLRVDDAATGRPTPVRLRVSGPGRHVLPAARPADRLPRRAERGRRRAPLARPASGTSYIDGGVRDPAAGRRAAAGRDQQGAGVRPARRDGRRSAPGRWPCGSPSRRWATWPPRAGHRRRHPVPLPDPARRPARSRGRGARRRQPARRASSDYPSLGRAQPTRRPEHDGVQRPAPALALDGRWSPSTR